MSFLDQVFGWMFGPKADDHEAPTAKDQETAYIRTMVLATLADGVRKDEEALAGRLHALSIPALAKLDKEYLAERISELTASLGSARGSFPLESLREMLPSAELRIRAYGLALAVIYADHEVLPEEESFLTALRDALQLSPGEAETLRAQVRSKVGRA